MQCNIDAKGKAARLTTGLVFVGIGLIGVIVHQLTATEGQWLLIAAIVMLLLGGFAMFEGWAGWCALRAMGFKTRI